MMFGRTDDDDDDDDSEAKEDTGARPGTTEVVMRGEVMVLDPTTPPRAADETPTLLRVRAAGREDEARSERARAKWASFAREWHGWMESLAVVAVDIEPLLAR